MLGLVDMRDVAVQPELECAQEKMALGFPRCMSRIAIALAVALFGCGSNATIIRPDYSGVEGTIVGSSQDAIYLESHGEEVRVDRSEIRDVDLPGNVALTTGILLAAYGVANIVVAAPKCDKEGAGYCTGVFTPAALGFGLIVYGGKVYGSALRLTRNFRRGRNAIELGVLPMFRVADGPPHAGLQLGGVF
jgi:hypothetical protein